jgi:hypothetical protein
MVFTDQKDRGKAVIIGDSIYTKPVEIIENISTKRP